MGAHNGKARGRKILPVAISARRGYLVVRESHESIAERAESLKVRLRQITVFYRENAATGGKNGPLDLRKWRPRVSDAYIILFSSAELYLTINETHGKFHAVTR